MATVAELEKIVLEQGEAIAKQGEEISLLKAALEDKAASPFVGYVLNNWQVRPALQLDAETLIVFTTGADDGAENERGLVTVRGAKQSNSQPRPGTWHNQESRG